MVGRKRKASRRLSVSVSSDDASSDSSDDDEDPDYSRTKKPRQEPFETARVTTSTTARHPSNASPDPERLDARVSAVQSTRQESADDEYETGVEQLSSEQSLVNPSTTSITNNDNAAAFLQAIEHILDLGGDFGKENITRLLIAVLDIGDVVGKNKAKDISCAIPGSGRAASMERTFMEDLTAAVVRQTTIMRD